MNVAALKQLGRCGVTAKEFARRCRAIANTGVTAEEAARNLTSHLDRLRQPLPPKV